MISRTPRFSVITLTHNRLDMTRACLPTLLGTRGSDWELIVVDNGSSDNTPEWVERDFLSVAAAAGVEARLIRNADNAGCATARNQGIAAARAAILVFVDNDIALRNRSWLQRLSAALAADPARAMVGGKLLYPFHPFQIQCAGVAVSPSGRITFRGRGDPRDDPRWNRGEPVQCLISACVMAHAEAVKEAGGFDEAFNPVQFEDFDLCYRLRSRGRSLWYEPQAEMYHFESATTRGEAGATANTYRVVRNGMLFKNRWREIFSRENQPEPTGKRWQWETMPDPTTARALPQTGDE